jgi:uncharacterized membrane protein
MSVYLILKVIHISAVVIFLGNIITGLFWMIHAKKTGSPSIVSHTMKGIIKSDKWFTLPGVLIIIAGGFAAAIRADIPILRTGWIFWSIVLFSISGIVFAWKLVPLQQRIYKVSFQMSLDGKTTQGWTDFEKMHTEWEAWGAVSLITPLVALVLMILKFPAETFLFV